jgi:uncharacterized protein YjbJ (UPF0337 family)
MGCRKGYFPSPIEASVERRFRAGSKGEDKGHTRKESAMGGTNDRAEGAWDKAKGKVKEGVGDATDDPRLEEQGREDQAKGEGKQAVGHAKDAAENLKEGVKDAMK